jgi:DNA polymerase III delta subunit
MAVLSGEVDKVSWLALSQGRRNADLSDVSLICSENIESEAFDLTNAVSAGDTLRALVVLDKMRSESKGAERDAPKFFGQIAKNFSLVFCVKSMSDGGRTPKEIADALGLTEFYCSRLIASGKSRPLAFYSRALSLCRETDVKIKTSREDAFLLLELLIIRLTRLKEEGRA